MADVRANGNGNGKEQFAGTIGGQTFSVSVRDLLSLLLLIGVFVLGFIVWQQMSLGLRLLHGQHRQIEEMLDDQNDLLRQQTEEMANFFYALDFNQGKPPEQRIPLRLYQQRDKPPTTGLTPQQREDKIRQDIEESGDPTLRKR